MKEKRKLFLNLPEFPGGNDSLIRYIIENLQYPELARLNNIEGTVYLTAVIDDSGIVTNVLIDKSLVYGCDEEAIRIISGLRFGKVKNRGRRVKINKKFRIEFKLPEDLSVKYNIVAESKIKSTGQVVTKDIYTYTFQINQD